MDVRGIFTRENAINGLKSVGKLRIRITHDSLVTFSALAIILFVAFAIRLFPLRWELTTNTVHITEFDGYFQYRFTQYIVKNGFISWAWPLPGWVDTQRWSLPGGRGGINVAGAGYPGLPMTAAFLYDLVSWFGVSIELMTFCAMLAPLFGMLASLVIYFLGKDAGGRSMGLLSALFVALSPSFIQRSSVGWFDDEIVGIPFIIQLMMIGLRNPL
jgi:asparagine N-glycosylation enzyme membrane subunit Stt3